MEEQEKDKKKKLRIIIIILLILLIFSILALGAGMIRNHITKESTNMVNIPDNIITLGKENSIDEDNSLKKESVIDKTAVNIALHNKNNYENVPFQVSNMFPGDKEIKYFCLKVSYENSVTVSFRANIRPGYEKLAEVLRCKVVLLSSGEIIYDGLMRDMPKSLNHTLNSWYDTTGEIYYEVTTYLDTSVGNEYMNKDLKADFCWWVEETGNLGSPMK